MIIRTLTISLIGAAMLSGAALAQSAGGGNGGGGGGPSGGAGGAGGNGEPSLISTMIAIAGGPNRQPRQPRGRAAAPTTTECIPQLERGPSSGAGYIAEFCSRN